jgi:hypothetical protein
MPKRINTNNRKTTTLRRFFSDASKVLINFCILGRDLILLSGRRILAVLSPLSEEFALKPGMTSVSEIITTKKSSMFQGFRK